jgi:hypothetical protein
VTAPGSDRTGDRPIGWLVRLSLVLFFLLLVLPGLRILVHFKELFFLLFVGVMIVRSARGIYLDKRVVIWTIALSAVSLLFTLRGLALGAPGALYVVRVHSIWPLVYLIVVSGIDNIRVFRGLDRTITVSSIFVALFGVYLLLAAVNILPGMSLIELMFTPEELAQGSYLTAAFGNDHAELAYTGLMSMPFLLPYLAAAVISRPSKTEWTSKRWQVVSLLLCVVVVLLSGRRALQLIALLAPLIVLGLGAFQPSRERRALVKPVLRTAAASVIVMIVTITLMLPVYQITFQGLMERFTTGFEFTASTRSESEVVRRDQYQAMMAEWSEDPWIGRGLGASAHALTRSDTVPWAYELSYIYLLFETGLVGFAVYTAGIAWIYWSGIKIIRYGGAGAQFMLPALAGLTGMLIANATNPYLSGSDGMWAIFLPLAFINCWLLGNKTVRGEAMGDPRLSA